MVGIYLLVRALFLYGFVQDSVSLPSRPSEQKKEAISKRQQQVIANEDVSFGNHGQFFKIKFDGSTYRDCFAASEDMSNERYDIAIVGAPLDTVSAHLDVPRAPDKVLNFTANSYSSFFKATLGRPGARYGPRGIRVASYTSYPRIANVFSSRHVHGIAPIKLIDCGDVPLAGIDNTLAFKQLEKAHGIIKSYNATIPALSNTPRVISLGGDHSTTYPALKSAFDRWGQVSVIHFDAHIDTWNPADYENTDYAKVNHATFLYVAHEEGLINDASIHVGTREPIFLEETEIQNDIKSGFSTIHGREIDKIGVDGIVEKIRERVGNNKVYISIDIDVLDPTYAPGTGTPAVGGFTSRELFQILEGLVGLSIIGADVVEVSPPFDSRGEITQLAGAGIVNRLVLMMARSPIPE
ncbi:hypothetical protein FQN57_001672 [Myotisia sp. PD_48]|nr:hypothetical protein FQN57_001672 [Myotisia sp. PD_48]